VALYYGVLKQRLGRDAPNTRRRYREREIFPSLEARGRAARSAAAFDLCVQASAKQACRARDSAILMIESTVLRLAWRRQS
jgi:hypothetical protein